MTFFAFIKGKSDLQMTDAAKVSVKDAFHREMSGGLLLDIKYVGMTIGTIQPLHMRLVRKDSGRDS